MQPPAQQTKNQGPDDSSLEHRGKLALSVSLVDKSQSTQKARTVLYEIAYTVTSGSITRSKAIYTVYITAHNRLDLLWSV